MTKAPHLPSVLWRTLLTFLNNHNPQPGTFYLSPFNVSTLVACAIPAWYDFLEPSAPADYSLILIHLNALPMGERMARSSIPDIVVGRLPLYLRALTQLELDGVLVTSSHELGLKLGISSAQIRKDLSHFGEFGKQGTGYHVSSLVTELQRILHIDRVWPVVLIGVGDLGRALARYGGFEHRGFRITHLFDNDASKIGQQFGGLTVEPISHLQERIQQSGVRVAMIATPASDAQSVASLLEQAGIRAILNYAPTILSVSENIRIQYIDPVIHLQRMSYYIDD